MLAIDKAINDTNEVICKNISKFDSSERGLLSQNILSQLRNFVEYISMKIYAKDYDINPNNYDEKCKALEFIKKQGKVRFLNKFHDLLQKSVSHYTLDGDNSERLMLKYYEHLLKIKNFLYENYNLEVLNNIEDFPLNTDKQVEEYNRKIAEKILDASNKAEPIKLSGKFYIQKNKPFFIDSKIYYEITFTEAKDKVSKFDRTIAFSNLEIMDNYAVKFSMHKDYIQVLNQVIEIRIIDSWEVAIRECEFKNFAFIFTGKSEIKSNTVVYKKLMEFLTKSKMSLFELITSDAAFYNKVKTFIVERARNTALFDIFDKCRTVIINGSNGANILRYLLLNMNNKVIKKQLDYKKEGCHLLPQLFFKYGCVPFEMMPYNTSLIDHNIRITDLLDCIPCEQHESELFARFIKNNTEKNCQLFTKEKDCLDFQNIDELINDYNSKLYYKHKNRELRKYGDNIYIKEYVYDCKEIIETICSLCTTGIEQYSNSVKCWLETYSSKIDSEEKKNALLNMFEKSKVSFIYGSAGTGKTTLIKYISDFFSNNSKLFLANTNPAVDNLKRKVITNDADFMTVSKFLSNSTEKSDYDLLFIDECSMVSNRDMSLILKKSNYKLLILVGDTYQIESINFGNWFSIAKSFVPKTSVIELTNTYRSSNNELKVLWERVRNLDDSITEFLCKNNYSKNLDSSVFEKQDDDEIILCLNYDGLYGINNINNFLQTNNENKGVTIGVNTYKVGDPILFNESNRFSPLIYNNMKGIIKSIDENDDEVIFSVKLDFAINELNASDYDFVLLEPAEDDSSVIKFAVKKSVNYDEEEADKRYLVPFQVAYAVSVHKAQGLEFNSVKIIVSNEVEEQVTHNIFYTAITRAKKFLQIYWTPEVQKYVISKFSKCDSSRDINILKQMFNWKS